MAEDDNLEKAISRSNESFIEDEILRRTLEASKEQNDEELQQTLQASLNLVDYTDPGYRPSSAKDTKHGFILGKANYKYERGSDIVDSNLCLFFSVANALQYYRLGTENPVKPFVAFNLKKSLHNAIDNLPSKIIVHTQSICDKWDFDGLQKETAKNLTKPNNQKPQEEDSIKALALYLNVGIRCYKPDGAWIEFRPEKPPYIVYIDEANEHFSPLYPKLPSLFFN